MSSRSRMLSVLDLFTSERPVWTAEEMIEKLGYSRPTGYRYVRELCASGLLARNASRYFLGPRVIELDYQIRQADPLTTSGQEVMKEIAERTGWSATLATMYGDRVLTIHLEQQKDGLDISYARGRPLPLFRGALSKTLVAFLPRARQRRLFEANPEEAKAIAPDLETFLARMHEIRRAGYGMSEGELDPENVAIAVPVFGGDGQVSCTLCLVLPRKRLPLVDRAALVTLLRDASTRLTGMVDAA